MEDLYSNLKHPEGVDLWACLFADNKEQVQYSNWRHLNPERQAIENRTWQRLILPPSKVLEIGCGRGFFLKRLFDNFGQSLDYYGLDISTRAVKHARRYFNHPRYLVSAGEALPFRDRLFDYVQIISTLEHVQEPVLVFREACRILRPGGFLYLVVHKRHLDPLILATLYRQGERMIREVFRLNGDRSGCGYWIPLSKVRRTVFKAAREAGLKTAGRGDLVPHLDIDFYRKLGFTLPSLFRVLSLAGRLPLSIFKNLEFIAYQK